jgi:Domain of unknown function (DUF5615)
MKFKLDENLGSVAAELIAESGHEVESVAQEKLSGASDARLFEVCIAERRCWISLDLDFADVLRFPPHNTPGIAVLRLPAGFGSSKRAVYASTRSRGRSKEESEARGTHINRALGPLATLTRTLPTAPPPRWPGNCPAR